MTVTLKRIVSMGPGPDGPPGYDGDGDAEIEGDVIVEEDTPILTTVHKIQVLDVDIPMTAHDVPIDHIVTRGETIECEKKGKPAGIIWEELDAKMLDAIPVLRALDSRKD